MTGRLLNHAPSKTKSKKKKSKSPALRIASWNVCTMQTGLFDNLQEVDHVHKTAVIDRELHRLGIDIEAL